MRGRMGALAVLVAVFLLGCLAGAGGLFVLWGSRALPVREFRSDAYGRGGMPPRLFESLHLSSDQESRVREILAESRKQLEAIRTESAPKAAAIRADLHSKVLAVLDDEQKKKYDELLKEMESRRERPSRRSDREPPRTGR